MTKAEFYKAAETNYTTVHFNKAWELYEKLQAENEALKQRINDLEETKSRMYDANQLMNARIEELEVRLKNKKHCCKCCNGNAFLTSTTKESTVLKRRIDETTLVQIRLQDRT